MRKGYWHTDRGYWETDGEPAASILANYPSGTVEITLRPGENYDWDGSDWVATPAPSPTEEDVDAEVARRTRAILSLQKQVETSLYGVALAFKGPENWNTADQEAVAAANALWAQIEPIRLKGEVLKAMDPIPQDYATNEAHWT